MRTDILFWFYKELPVCRERVAQCRALNPDARIYGLYGGPPERYPEAQAALGPMLDDLYLFPEDRSSRWKWRHGEQLLYRWFRERGRHLDWDRLFLYQWDLVTFEPLGTLLADVPAGTAMLTGFRPMDSVRPWWHWSDPNAGGFQAFRSCLAAEHGYRRELYACLFIAACFPRPLLRDLAASACGGLGFLEYSIPTLARALGYEVVSPPALTPWWAADPSTRNVPRHRVALNAVAKEIPPYVIDRELASPSGQRAFHPVFRSLRPPAPYRLAYAKGRVLDAARSVKRILTG